MVNPAVIKAAIVLGKEKKVRKFLAGVLVAILSPVIVVMVLLRSLGTGAAQHNISAVQLCFDGGAIPAGLPAEYRAHIEEMRSSFDLLDDAVDEINGQTEDGQSLDSTRVKAIFYALVFGEETPSRRDCRQFVNCFVNYETRTRTVTWTDDGGNEHEREEVYTVAVPVDNLVEVYQKINVALSLETSADQQANAESVYQLARYGYVSGGSSGWSGELDAPFIGADGFCSPVGAGWRNIVTSEFGYRRDPFTGQTRGHSGMDLAVSTGTPIRAALAGTVTVAAYDAGGYGHYVMLNHGGGLVTLYAHNSRLLVRVGQQVEAGDVVSLSGSTGRSTGPHLHFEVRVNGERTNPRAYLP